MSTLSAASSISEFSSQNAYAKQVQGSTEISTTEHTQKMVNAPAEAKSQQAVQEQAAQMNSEMLSKEIPSKLPFNTTINAAITRTLLQEFSQFPDIDHAKVNELLADPASADVDVGMLSESMLHFYQSGR
ncbi:hypothetical protein [Aeromonas aquatica]|uniref:hypothetical protein n=1 Tax=Aeromonas aquatica TaxID=558964 RepID=UPI00286F4FA6|nr:hypothetical protein [Aeromonas aquatica]